MFLVEHFNNLAPQLYLAESFDDVMTTMKDSLTVINVTCFEVIADHYKIEDAITRIVTYKSTVDEICEEFRRNVVEKENLTTDSLSIFKYEEIVFVLGWHRMDDDLTFDDIDGLLRKGFGDMTEGIWFKYGSKRDTERVEWRDDDNSVLTISPTAEQCRNIVSRLIKEEQPGKEWRIELRSSSAENALIIISDLDKFSVRELCIDETPLDSMCVSTLSRKFTKVKKLMFKYFTLPVAGIKQLSDALITNTSLEALLMWYVPITDEDTGHLSNMLSYSTTLQTLDLSNCDITDNGVKNICKGLTKNQAVTLLAFTSNLHITSDSTSSIVDLIKATKSLETLYLRNTLLNGYNIKRICDELANNSTIQKLVLSEQHEKICKTLPKSIKDRLYFVKEEPSGAGLPQKNHHKEREPQDCLEVKKGCTSIDRPEEQQQQQDQSPVDTLSRKEEIEKLIREKEATDRLLVEKQKEIEKLTREKEATDRILVEKQEEIEKLTREKEGLLDLQDKVQVSTGYSDKCDYWNYTNISESFEGMVTVGKKLCQYDAQVEHTLILEECGLRLVIPREVITPVESIYKVAAQGLWGADKFEFPESSTLISAVCYVSVCSSSEFNKPVSVELMHSANITDERQTQYLSFVTAKSGPPFKFDYLPGGSFSSDSHYGTISLKQFSLIAIVIIAAIEVRGIAAAVVGSAALGSAVVGGTVFGATGAIAGGVLGLVGARYLVKSDSVKRPDCHYQAYVFYNRIDPEKWNMNFAVIQDSVYSKFVLNFQNLMSNKFGKEHSNFRFHFAGEEVNQKTALTLSGFPDDNVMIKGWKMQPLRTPPVINKTDIDDFNESKSFNPPYISVLVLADPDSSDFKKQLQYPLTIEGIKVTDQTSSNTSQPKIVIDVSTHTEDPRSLQSASAQHPFSQDVFRTHYAKLSRLVSDSNNRLSLANELFSAQLITLDCYNSATDDSAKKDMEKGVLLMKGLMTSINTQPQLLGELINVLKKLEVFWSMAENMEHDLL